MVRDHLQHRWCLSRICCLGEKGETGREGGMQAGMGRKVEVRDEQSRLRYLRCHLQGASPLDLGGLAKGPDDQPDAAQSGQ